jgi:hypothetical protein
VINICIILAISHRAMKRNSASARAPVGLCDRLWACGSPDCDSFFVAGTNLVWEPRPGGAGRAGDCANGVRLVFFIHITTDPDNTNNVMALAFGLLIVFLVVGGSLWIMSHLNQNMPPMDQIMRMQR